MPNILVPSVLCKIKELRTAEDKKVIKNSLFDYAGIKCHSYQMSDCHDTRTISNSEYGGAVKCLTGTKTCSRKEILHMAKTTISYWTKQLCWSVYPGG